VTRQTQDMWLSIKDITVSGPGDKGTVDSEVIFVSINFLFSYNIWITECV
jgi:hypothetical protein